MPLTIRCKRRGDGSSTVVAARVIEACRGATDGRVRSAILDILAAADLRGEGVRQLYLECAADSEPRARQSAIAGLESMAAAGDHGARATLLGMVVDPNLDVRVRALLALAACGDFQRLAPATAALTALLANADAAVRGRGVRVLGQLRGAGASEWLLPYLADPADGVRMEAALALERRAGELPATMREGLPGLAARIDHSGKIFRQAAAADLRYCAVHIISNPKMLYRKVSGFNCENGVACARVTIIWPANTTGVDETSCTCLNNKRLV